MTGSKTSYRSASFEVIGGPIIYYQTLASFEAIDGLISAFKPLVLLEIIEVPINAP